MPQLKDALDNDTRKTFEKMAKEDHERPGISREAYETRLDSIVNFCGSPRRTAEIAKEFGYASGASAILALRRLVNEGRLMREGRGVYVSVHRRTLSSVEAKAYQVKSFEERYIDALTEDAQKYVWESDFVNPRTIKHFLAWIKEQHNQENQQ